MVEIRYTMVPHFWHQKGCDSFRVTMGDGQKMVLSVMTIMLNAASTTSGLF